MLPLTRICQLSSKTRLSPTSIRLAYWLSVVDHSRIWRLIQMLSALSYDEISHIQTLWDFMHVLMSFDIWFEYIPRQWNHFSLEQNRNFLKIKMECKEIFFVLTKVQSGMIIVTWCQFSHTPLINDHPIFYIDAWLSWTMKSIGWCKFQVTEYIKLNYIVVSCFVITSYQVLVSCLFYWYFW